VTRRTFVFTLVFLLGTLAVGTAKAVMMCIEDAHCETCYLWADDARYIGYVTNC
jgi:hypothetical protein